MTEFEFLHTLRKQIAKEEEKLAAPKESTNQMLEFSLTCTAPMLDQEENTERAGGRKKNSPRKNREVREKKRIRLDEALDRKKQVLHFFLATF